MKDHRKIRRLLKSKNALIGGSILITVIAMAIFAPLIAPYHYSDGDLSKAFKPVFSEKTYILGTDNIGRDMFSRLIYGARISLLVGIFAQLVNTIIGGSLGVVAGYFGGRVDDFIMFMTNVVLSVPVLIFSIALMVLLGPGLTNLFIAIGITNWSYSCRMARSKTLSIKEEVFVEAARAIGDSNFKILRKHIFPNLLSPLIVIGTMGIGDAILIAASLGFLGLGAQPPLPEWGTMLSTGRKFIFNYPMLSILPGIAIFLTVLGFNLFGDGVRDVLDPHTVMT